MLDYKSRMVKIAIERLLEYVKQVCVVVIGADYSTRVSISAFNEGDADFPVGISATHEYMVFIDFSEARELMPEALRGLSLFLKKNVLICKSETTHCLYWGDGDPLNGMPIIGSKTAHQDAIVHASNYDSLQAVQWLKTNTVLPNWLEYLIFDIMEARHEPNWQRFEHNMELDADEIKVYLGTYFPRSYAEAFCILDALFATSAYSTAWAVKTDAWILDLGCGTGGNLIGLLTVLAKHCPHLSAVHIHAFDGNELALDALKTILHAFTANATFAVDVDITVARFTALDDFPVPTSDSYDFITSFKMGNEIISTGAGLSDGFYHRFLSFYTPLLSKIGLLLLLDVTTKPKHADNYYPMFLNNQGSQFVREQPAFVTLIPVPCHLYETSCDEQCFTQKEFSITHRARRNDLSRVAYRVLARKALASAFYENIERDAEYVISTRVANDRCTTCTYSDGRGKRLDGYRIST